MLAGVQKLLMTALLSDDPPGALARALPTADLSPEERRWLETLDMEGLVMTSLMVKKLRFQRITIGDRDMAELFQEDPKSFMDLYEAYTIAVPPDAYFPDEEGERFRVWQATQERAAET